VKFYCTLITADPVSASASDDRHRALSSLPFLSVEDVRRRLGFLPLSFDREPAAVFKGCQPRLHIVEFRGRDHILLLRRQNLRDLLLRFCNAIRSLGWSEKTWPWCLAFSLLRLTFSKKLT